MFYKDVEDVDSSAYSLPTNLNTCENMTDDCIDEVLSASYLNHQEANCRSDIFSSQSSTSTYLVGDDIEASSTRCQSVERSDLLSPAKGNKLEKGKGKEFMPVKPIIRYISSPGNCAKHTCSQNMSGHTETMGTFNNIIEKDNSENIISNNLECNTACGYLDQTLINETAKGIETSSHQPLLVNASSRCCCTAGHPEGSCCLSVGASQNMQAEDNQSSVTSQVQQLSVHPLSGPRLQHSNPEGQLESSQIPERLNNSSESSICNSVQMSGIDLDNSNISIHKTSNKTSDLNNKNNNNNDLICKHSIENRDLKKLSAMKKSHHKEKDENKNDLLGCRGTHCDTDVLSSEQHPNFNTEDINCETLFDGDVPASCVNSVYHRQEEEEDFHLRYGTTAMAEDASMSVIQQYDPYESQVAGWESGDSSDDAVSSGTLPNSQMLQNKAFPTEENTVTWELDTSSDDQEVASTCSSVASSQSSERNHEAALSADDQTLKSPATRQPVVVTCMPAGCSIPYLSDMNCTMYGTAVVQALGRPVVMSSPLVNFARRPGGVRMMMQQQHQSVNRGTSRANVVKHQALSDGIQATSVLQHHSLTNGGQTVLVQQRTMMTAGLSGLAQQTVFQQQVAAPAAMTQSTMMHMGAARQRALTAQQASLIQQRGIRYIPTGVLGAPLLQSQTIQSTSVIEERAAALMGHGLVRGVNQSHMMQHLVQQRYLGGPLVPCRRVQLVAGHKARTVNK